MYERSSSLILRWLKVPSEPHAPFGDPASLRVFRAGKNFFNLKLFGWALGQAFALAGIIFWVVVFVQVEEGARLEKIRRAALPLAPNATLHDKIKATAENAANSVIEASQPAKAPAAAPGAAKPAKRRVQVSGWAGFKQGLIEIALVLPPWAFPLLWALKITGIVAYLVQIPFTYAVMRLDFEMRWYVVTDRSLRIRTGVWNVQEITMSFANLQQVETSQGPLQRLLGLADVKVQSAGGGDVAPGQHGKQDSLHTGHFHCVENAQEIRDLIQERLRRFRESGLGDPEELHRAAANSAPAVMSGADVLAAARELAAEARALRQALL
jgi:membrane protein YdbS with pleckstrin-like domain